MNKENVTVVVLATGLTDRMNSKKSKLLMSICGKPMAAYAIEAAQAVSASKPVMVVSPTAKAPIISARCEIDLSPGTVMSPDIAVAEVERIEVN